MATPKVIAFFETTLASAITSSATSFTLTSAEDKEGVSLAADTYGFVIDEGSSNEEIVIATCTGTACTSAKRGVSVSDGDTEVAALKKAHRRGASIKITDAPFLLLAASKEYVDGVAIAGASDASATGKGIVEIALQAEIDADTRLGSTGAVLAVAPDVLAASKYGVLVSAFTGVILPYAGTTAPTGFLLCDGSAVSRTTYSDLYAVTGDAYGAGNGSTTFNLPDLRSSFPLGGGTARTRTMTFDGASAVDPATDTITVTSNDWLHTGQAVALTGSSLPTGLSATTYYVVRTSATAIKLATSVANANAGTVVDITADGSGTCTLTQTLTARTVGATGGEETHALADDQMPSHSHTTASFYTTTGSNRASGSNSGMDTTSGTGVSGSDTPHNIMPIYTVVSYIIKT